MSLTQESLRNIQKWARATFPEDFKKVDDYLRHNEIAHVKCELHHPDDQIDDDSKEVQGIIVGTTGERNQPVYALVDLKGSLRLYREPGAFDKVETVHLTHPKDKLYAVKCSISVIHFRAPFRWLHLDEGEMSKMRIEALIQYLYMWFTLTIEILPEDKIQFSGEIFEGVCRDIASGVAGAEIHGIALRAYFKHPPSFFISRTQTDSVNLVPEQAPPPRPDIIQAVSGLSAPMTVSRKRPRTTEEAFTAFRGDLDEVTSAAQKADGREREKLVSRIHWLENQLANTGEERDKYKTEVTIAEEKAKKAEEEASKSKAEYEELKEVMQKSKAQFEELGKMMFQGDAV